MFFNVLKRIVWHFCGTFFLMLFLIKNTMKRRFPFFSFIILLFSSLFFVTGCNESQAIEGIHMASEEVIDVPYGNFSYEGINIVVDFKNGSNKAIPLEEEMISPVERTKFFKMGNQNVEVMFRNKYKTEMPINVILNKFKDTYALNGYECTYDGLPHIVTLNHELPEGASIVYPYGNVFTNAGTYEVVGVMSKKGYESKTLTTTLTVHKADRDADGIVFEDATLVYNGEMRTIIATNVPEGVEVTYDTYDSIHDIRINKVVNAGTYKIVAHFTDTSANYNKIPDKEAILTIQKADYDLSAIKLENHTKEFDGEVYTAQILNASELPQGISVHYRYLDEYGNQVMSNAPVGKYTIVAEFIGGDINNYNPIEPLTATLTVSKRVVKISDKVSLESKTVNFDGNIHSLAITGDLPTNVQVSYENNDQKYAGEYEVIAKFEATNPNETVDIEEISSYLIINKVRRSVMVYNTLTEEYDKEFSAENIVVEGGNVSIVGFDETVFRVQSISFHSLEDNELVNPADFVNGTTYSYVIKFEYLDEGYNNSVILSDESDNFKYIEA